MIFRCDVDRAVVPASLRCAAPASTNGGRLGAICRAKSCQEETFVNPEALRPHISFKYWCTNATAIAPSPTAEATRLMEPERTSPAASTPGRLVSSRYG